MKISTLSHDAYISAGEIDLKKKTHYLPINGIITISLRAMEEITPEYQSFVSRIESELKNEPRG